jgi:hypothetical protein
MKTADCQMDGITGKEMSLCPEPERQTLIPMGRRFEETEVVRMLERTYDFVTWLLGLGATGWLELYCIPLPDISFHRIFRKQKSLR